MSISRQIRQAIDDSGMTRYVIARESGITESTLSRFYASGKGLSMVNADRLCEFLRLELTKKAGKPRKER